MRSSLNRINVGNLLLILTWIGMQIFILSTYGIVTENEAGKYINQAELLSQTGHLSHPSMWLYAIEILLITVSKLTGLGFIAVVIVQLILNAIATLFFYRVTRELTTEITAFIITLLLIINFVFQSFNSFLYTESVFFSLSIILACYLFSISRLGLTQLFTISILLLLLCFTRPSGLLFVPPVLIFIFTRFLREWKTSFKIGSFIFLLLVFIFLLNLVIGSGGELDFMLPFREEHIICGVPTIVAENISAGRSYDSLAGILNYLVDHPAQVFRLAVRRTIAFFGLFRDYYSAGHNVYLAISVFPVYLFAILSIPSWFKKNRPLLYFCITIIGLTWFTVMLTCDDWHNRFFLSIIPFFYLLAIPAVEHLIKRFTKNRK